VHNCQPTHELQSCITQVVGKEPRGQTSEKENLLIDVGFGVFTVVVMRSIIFWDMTSCSPLSFNRRFGITYRLHLQGRINPAGGKPPASCCFFAELISSNLKTEAICSPETAVDTQRHYISEADTLHNHRCEKPQILQFFYCCVYIIYRGNFSTQPLPSNDRGILPSGCRHTYRSHIRDLISLLYFFKIRKVG
jgi:hypothetical protein